MKMKIREYQESDRTAFVELMEHLMDYIVSIDDLKRTRRMPEFGESYVQRTLQKVAENNGIIYVAELDSELVGVVVGTIPEQSKEDLLEHVPSKFGEVLEIKSWIQRQGRWNHADEQAGRILQREQLQHLRSWGLISQQKCSSPIQQAGLRR